MVHRILSLFPAYQIEEKVQASQLENWHLEGWRDETGLSMRWKHEKSEAFTGHNLIVADIS
jgi:hypothetical protein